MRRPQPLNPSEPPTCPSCGALVGEQMERCRRCGSWLRGNAVENTVYAAILPAGLRRWTGSARLFVLILAYFIACGVLTQGQGFLSLSSFSLQRLGAMHGAHIALGEYWRAVSSVFIHHDLLHLAFNLLALAIAAPIVERFYGRWSMTALFVFAGAGSMLASHLWYTLSGGSTGLLYTSGGASGAISALIGCAWAAAGRVHGEDDTRKRMLVWSVWMLIIGFGFGGAINNAAHIGGWVLGALWGRFGVRPASAHAEEANWQRATGIVALLVVALAMTLTFMHAAQRPVVLHNDGYARSIFGFSVSSATAWERSDQVRYARSCATAYLDRRTDDEAARTCALATDLMPHVGDMWRMRAAVEDQRISERRRTRYLRISERLE